MHNTSLVVAFIPFSIYSGTIQPHANHIKCVLFVSHPTNGNRWCWVWSLAKASRIKSWVCSTYQQLLLCKVRGFSALAQCRLRKGKHSLRFKKKVFSSISHPYHPIIWLTPQAAIQQIRDSNSIQNQWHFNWPWGALGLDFVIVIWKWQFKYQC